jgi:hypothetical protein
LGGKGQPGGAGCVESGIEDGADRGGNPVLRLRVDEGVGEVGRVRVKMPVGVPLKRRRRLRVGRPLMAGVGDFVTGIGCGTGQR